MITSPQRVALDKVFLELLSVIQDQLTADAAKHRFLTVLHDAAAAATALDSSMVSVVYHEDQYGRGDAFNLDAIKKIQPAEGKNAVLEAVQEFCRTTGLSDAEGYSLFKEYFHEIPFKNGQHGERDVLGKIQQIQGPQRTV